MSIISKYTLKINDEEISGAFQKYLTNNVMKFTKVLLGVETFVLLMHLTDFFTGGLFPTLKVGKSVATLAIVGACYGITRMTKNTVSIKLMPFLFMLSKALT